MLCDEKNDFFTSQKLSKDEFESFELKNQFPKNIILQVSSGSSEKKTILIPRTYQDILNIHNRIMESYLTCYSTLPKKIALLGGISHTQAALKMKIDQTEVISFSLDELRSLETFNPDVISCYPSIMRELIAFPNLNLNSLKGIKVGGEPLLNVDLENIKKRFPAIIVLEQYGSTEMPAVGIGCYKKFIKTGIKVQKSRFEVKNMKEASLAPIIVFDKFDDLLFKIPGYYDTGDEGIKIDEHLFEIRRQHDESFAFRELSEKLLDSDIINIQVQKEHRSIFFQGSSNLKTISFQGHEYQLIANKLKRLRSSNKLPLLISLNTFNSTL